MAKTEIIFNDLSRILNINHTRILVQLFETVSITSTTISYAKPESNLESFIKSRVVPCHVAAKLACLIVIC